MPADLSSPIKLEKENHTKARRKYARHPITVRSRKDVIEAVTEGAPNTGARDLKCRV